MGAGVLTGDSVGGSFHRPSSGVLHCEELPLALLAERVGTPAFVYSSAAIRAQHARLAAALDGVPHRVHYSVKANSSLAVLSLMHELGAGVDIVSGGELHRALLAGIPASAIVFSGVGKTRAEIEDALHAGIAFFNVESEGELLAIDAIAGELSVIAPVALRINPEVAVETAHRYTRTGAKGDKFGIPYDDAVAVARLAAGLPNVELVGLDMHVGSQLTNMEPYRVGVDRLLGLLEAIRDCGTLRWLDLGGGLAVPYAPADEEVDLASFGAVARHAAHVSGLELVVEPGRFLVANAGILLTRVLYRKRSGGKDYVIVDAGMTELLRPSHYLAHHRVEPVDRAPAVVGESHLVDVVGPVCESGDFLALDRELGDAAPGELLGILSAGAYGYVMASNYNSRCRPPEVLVDGTRFAVVTRRETVDDLTRLESATPRWEDPCASA